MSWQPIETAPRDGTFIFLVDRGKPYVGCYVSREEYSFGKLERKTEGWTLYGDMRFLGPLPEPTHWMPIPHLESDVTPAS